jgi:purine-binding chemotaxis protein CheW
MPGEVGLEGDALIVELDGSLCAIPLRSVIETMRPLRVEPISGAPSFVKGVAVVRGIPTPVIDLHMLLGSHVGSYAERFVTVRAGERQVALAVRTVVGVRNLKEALATQQLPPLLHGTPSDAIETIGTLDEEFLVVLRRAWKVPEELWNAVTPAEAVS